MAKEKKNKSVLNVQNLVVDFPLNRKKKLHAVVGISFDIQKGETFGLVGESGCGKTSVARAVMQIPPPTSGKIFLCEEELTQTTKQRLRQLRPRFQIVFQDSISALNPRRKIGDTIAMPLHVLKKGDSSEKKQAVIKMMNLVGVDPDFFDRKPYELSGGQCQRVQIARALMTKPELLILDEPVSSLDVSVQAQIINLLEKLRKRYGLTMLFISHDLAVVKNVCDRVGVMYLGKLCEIAPSENLYHTPLHPYTRALLRAIPRPDPFQLPTNLPLISPEMPSPTTRISGCRFKTRCPEAVALCEDKDPVLKQITPGHWVACHLKRE